MSKHYIFVDFFFARSIKIDVIRTNGKGRVPGHSFNLQSSQLSQHKSSVTGSAGSLVDSALNLSVDFAKGFGFESKSCGQCY